MVIKRIKILFTPFSPLLLTANFLKPFLKGNILQSERVKFDFDHYFAFLAIFLKKYSFLPDGMIFQIL